MARAPQKSGTSQAQTVLALKALDKGQITKARAIVARIKDPLASKLYQWMRFTDKKALRGANSSDFGQMSQFIRKNPDWPGIKTMRKQIELQMPDNSSPMRVIAWFDDYKPSSAHGTDLYLQALKTSGQKQKMRLFLQDWWAATPLSRNDQVFLFKKYKASLTAAAHKKRFDTLLFAGQYENARAVANVLGHGYPALAEARIALAENKGGVNQYINKIPKRLLSDYGLQYQRLKWRRKNDMNMAAIQILQAPMEFSRISNPKDWWLERHIIIRRLLEKKQYESAYLLASNHMQKKGLPFAQAEWMAGWLSLQFLNNPHRAFKHFENLYNGVKSPISKARAAYWGGRAASAVGRSDVSAPWYNAAAQFQISFYGQLAAKELSIGGKLPHKPPPTLSIQDKKKLDGNEFVRVIRLFRKAKMNSEVKRFLYAYTKTLKTPKQYRFAAEFAAEMGYYHNAIRIAKNATKEGMFLTAQSYPLVTGRLKKVKLEWSLIHGLIRQESAFNFGATSRTGASGLMQLMPATAREVAQRNGISHRQDWLASRPDHNIQLGSLYLGQMLRRFDGYYPMAIAAYNAGPNRVDKWIKIYGDPRKSEIDMIDWIEMIPIYETRNYVQRVMEATYVYRLRLRGKEPPLKKGLLHTKT